MTSFKQILTWVSNTRSNCSSPVTQWGSDAGIVEVRMTPLEESWPWPWHWPPWPGDGLLEDDGDPEPEAEMEWLEFSEEIPESEVIVLFIFIDLFMALLPPDLLDFLLLDFTLFGVIFDNSSSSTGSYKYIHTYMCK